MRGGEGYERTGEEMTDKVFPRGMRPVAMDAVSERERAAVCPHRHQSGRNLARAQKAEELAGENACPTGRTTDCTTDNTKGQKAAKKGGKRK